MHFPPSNTSAAPSTPHPNILREEEEHFSTQHNEDSDNLAGSRGVPGMEQKAQNRYPGRKEEMVMWN